MTRNEISWGCPFCGRTNLMGVQGPVTTDTVSAVCQHCGLHASKVEWRSEAPRADTKAEAAGPDAEFGAPRPGMRLYAWRCLDCGFENRGWTDQEIEEMKGEAACFRCRRRHHVLGAAAFMRKEG